MTFWRNVLPNMLLHGQNALLVVSTCLQNFYQWGVLKFYNWAWMIEFLKHFMNILLKIKVQRPHFKAFGMIDLQFATWYKNLVKNCKNLLGPQQWGVNHYKCLNHYIKLWNPPIFSPTEHVKKFGFCRYYLSQKSEDLYCTNLFYLTRI